MNLRKARRLSPFLGCLCLAAFFSSPAFSEGPGDPDYNWSDTDCETDPGPRLDEGVTCADGSRILKGLRLTSPVGSDCMQSHFFGSGALPMANPLDPNCGYLYFAQFEITSVECTSSGPPGPTVVVTASCGNGQILHATVGPFSTSSLVRTGNFSPSPSGACPHNISISLEEIAIHQSFSLEIPKENVFFADHHQTRSEDPSLWLIPASNPANTVVTDSEGAQHLSLTGLGVGCSPISMAVDGGAAAVLPNPPTALVVPPTASLVSLVQSCGGVSDEVTISIMRGLQLDSIRAFGMGPSFSGSWTLFSPIPPFGGPWTVSMSVTDSNGTPLGTYPGDILQVGQLDGVTSAPDGYHKGNACTAVLSRDGTTVATSNVMDCAVGPGDLLVIAGIGLCFLWRKRKRKQIAEALQKTGGRVSWVAVALIFLLFPCNRGFAFKEVVLEITDFFEFKALSPTSGTQYLVDRDFASILKKHSNPDCIHAIVKQSHVVRNGEGMVTGMSTHFSGMSFVKDSSSGLWYQLTPETAARHVTTAEGKMMQSFTFRTKDEAVDALSKVVSAYRNGQKNAAGVARKIRDLGSQMINGAANSKILRTLNWRAVCRIGVNLSKPPLMILLGIAIEQSVVHGAPAALGPHVMYSLGKEANAPSPAFNCRYSGINLYGNVKAGADPDPREWRGRACNPCLDSLSSKLACGGTINDAALAQALGVDYDANDRYDLGRTYASLLLTELRNCAGASGGRGSPVGSKLRSISEAFIYPTTDYQNYNPESVILAPYPLTNGLLSHDDICL